MSLDGNRIQQVFIRAIEEYTDRHNSNFGEVGAKDLLTLSEANPQSFFQAFNTSLETGLTSQNVEINAKKYGRNIYRKRKKVTFCQIFKDAICDEMLIILMIAAVISVVVQYFAGLDKQMFWVQGVSIMFAVIICSMVATYSNYQKQKQFAQLDQMTEDTYNYEVFRDGRRISIHRSDIVPGDIILISNGLEIPADCILYKAINVIVDQSSITGQSNEMEKNNFDVSMEQRMNPDGATPFMVSGSNVVTGEGLMMAVVVGKDSKAGKNYQLIFSQDDDDQQQLTPLQKKLEKLANQIGHFGLISAILIVVLLIIRLIIEDFQKGSFNFSENLGKIINFIIIGVTVIVVAIPQGLPLAVTLTLAYSMKAMHEDKILVRELESCETMGAATYICSDKTGTITQNKMNVRQVFNKGPIPIQNFTRNNIHPGYLQLLVNGIFHNSSAIVDSQKGAQTQIALLKMARNLSGRNQEIVRRQYGKNYFKRLPFDSNRKRMTTGFQMNDQDLLFMSGASQQILQNCNYLQSSQNGMVQPFNPQTKGIIFQQIGKMANNGLRTIAIAYKAVNRRSIYANSSPIKRKILEDVETSDFVLLGVFGIEDPPRAESKQSIQDCQNAGIHVIMVTGDNKITATNIARQVGIINENGGRVMEASQFINILQKNGILKEKRQQEQEEKKSNSSKSSNSDKKSKAQKQFSGAKHIKRVYFDNQKDKQVFQSAIKDLAVMARSKPQHKFILVDGINKLGHVVAVTGDGANDAPALMRADIGLAMGVTGTQIAKNASDIILLDDNFRSIVRAVVWGRNVYDSIRKFLQFQLTVNVIALGLIILSAAIIKQSVFATVQMLWVNLIMDSLAALALATQPPNHQQLLRQRPNSEDEQFITPTMIKHIVGQAIFQIFILCIILFLGHKMIPESRDSFDGIIGSDLAAKYNNGLEGTVTDGKLYNINGSENYKVWFDKYHNYSRHLTFLFNTFVFLQVFNFICCRRIRDELNMFSGICSSKIFWAIIFFIVLLQVILTTFGGRFFQVYRYGGLTIVQWLLSIGVGFLVIPVSFFLRMLPIAKPAPLRDQRYSTKQEVLNISQISPNHISYVR